ncbi:nucleocapsid protein [RtClan arterivirus]|uniref:Nucleoprotein n=1 Tax=RtClan arterivirus TaxID=2847271 RepID=A0A2H4MWQ5_9NIDO|nr:nucleocapsid protein [Rodent arterivirus]ATP66651.1 nucleocapsid protein [RtClan arterivirus]
MPNKRGKAQKNKRSNGQPVAQLCQLLSSYMQQNKQQRRGNKKREGKPTQQPHFPLATEDDVRHHFTPTEQRLALQSIQIAFTQGAGSAAMSDSGRITYQVEFSLPTNHTVRLIRATQAQASG